MFDATAGQLYHRIENKGKCFVYRPFGFHLSDFTKYGDR
jgi:hypothetical protein